MIKYNKEKGFDLMENNELQSITMNDSNMSQYESSTTTEIIKALIAARSEMKTMPADESYTRNANGYGKPIKYININSILDYIVPILLKHELFLSQGLHAPFNADIHILHTKIRHISGEWIEARTVIPERNNDQEMGSTMTYRQRYSLVSLLGLPVDKDDDGQSQAAAYKQTPKKNYNLDKPIEYISSQDIVDLKAALMGYSSLQEQLQKRYADINLIPADKVDAIFEWIAKETAKIT